jgi:1-deoxy-D-xylulose-5-phosphate reductoisomerase
MMKKVAIVGSTGSIGTQAVSIIHDNPGRFVVSALAAHRNVALISEQARRLRPAVVALADESAAEELRKLVPAGTTVLSGAQGVARAAVESGADIVLSAMVGSAGLVPTMAAIDAGIDIALANKETLVCAGALVTGRAKERGVELIPVDSEHSALFQSLLGHDKACVKRLIITASGGPFWKRRAEELESVTPEEAVKHPRWNMGKKISVDSATLMNKALELIEARWLFDVPHQKIAVLIHPESIVHSMVEYIDGSIVAQLGPTDMRIPIAYALTYPERIESPVAPLDLSAIDGGLTFFGADEARFRPLALAREALDAGGTMPAVMSAANEAAVELFLSRKIAFPHIVQLVEKVMGRHRASNNPSLAELIEVDRWARDMAITIGEEA